LVEQLGLTSYFSRIDGNYSPAAVGKAGALHQHLDALELSAGVVVMIGDSVDDGLAATAAGCRCVLIDSGHTTPAALAESGWPIATDLLDALSIATEQPRLQA
jgi:phosphoglycolate phosphatase